MTSVAGGFPAAQTYLEVKMLEVAMAVENGADEIDVVMNAGEMVEGEFDRLANDLELLCREAGQEVTFKVIIESGMLETPEDVYRASMLAILSGADFVKTSTGKSAYGATPKSAMVICNAIKDYYLQTGINVGIAGGRYPYRGRCRALLYHRGKYARPRVAYPVAVPFRGECSVSQRFAVGRNGRYTVLLLNLRLFGNRPEISGARDNRCICKAGPPKVSFGGPALQMLSQMGGDSRNRILYSCVLNRQPVGRRIARKTGPKIAGYTDISVCAAWQYGFRSVKAADRSVKRVIGRTSIGGKAGGFLRLRNLSPLRAVTLQD